MMGTAQYNLKPPTVKTTSSVLAIADIDKVFSSETPCIRCGKCVSHCPMRLMPLNLNLFSRNKNYEMAEKYHITDCIECGLCSYMRSGDCEKSSADSGFGIPQSASIRTSRNGKNYFG